MSKPFTDRPVYPDESKAKSGLDAIVDVFRHDKNVFCVIARSNNGNLVTFAGEPPTKSGGKIGVDQFWVDLDPSAVKKARSSGKKHDRNEMTIIDDQAYGYMTLLSNGDTILNMQNVRRPVIIRKGANGGYKAFVKINDKMCLLKYVWVSVGSTMGIIPTVDYIDIVGYDSKRNKVTERVRK